jgi:chromosome segregation ATPase
VLAVALGAHSALAQTPRSGGGAAENAQLLQQIQQIASERTTLQAENAKLTKEIEDTRKDRDALKNGHEVNDRRALAEDAALAHVSEERDTREKDLTLANQRLKDLRDKFEETTRTLHDMESARAGVRATLATRQSEFATCVNRNQKLYELNVELVSLFEAGRAAPGNERAVLDALVENYPANAADNSMLRPH